MNERSMEYLVLAVVGLAAFVLLRFVLRDRIGKLMSFFAFRRPLLRHRKTVRVPTTRSTLDEQNCRT